MNKNNLRMDSSFGLGGKRKKQRNPKKSIKRGGGKESKEKKAILRNTSQEK